MLSERSKRKDSKSSNRSSKTIEFPSNNMSIECDELITESFSEHEERSSYEETKMQKKSRKKRIRSKIKTIEAIKSIIEDKNNENVQKNESNNENLNIHEVKLKETSVIEREEVSFQSDSKFSGNKSFSSKEELKESKSSKITQQKKQKKSGEKSAPQLKASSSHKRLSKKKKNKKEENAKEDLLMTWFDKAWYFDFTHFFLRKQYGLESVIVEWRSKKPNILKQIEETKRRYLAYDRAYKKSIKQIV